MHMSETGKELFITSGHDNITNIHYVTTELAQTTSVNR
jgi:hypothetical protein